MVRRLGNIYGFTGGSFAGIVYDKRGLSPALKTMQGGNRQPLVIVDDLYSSRAPRVYKEACPTLRADRQGLKVVQIPIDGTINRPRANIEVANCIKARYDAGISNQRQDGTMVLEVSR